MALIILRCMFVLAAAGAGVLLIRSDSFPTEPHWLAWPVFGAVLLGAVAIIAVDALVPRKPLDLISSVYFGMVVGLFLAYVVILALAPLLGELKPYAQSAVNTTISIILCYTCISLLMQTRNDFRFVIPYVEFSRQVKGVKPLVLDTSAVIDGRIADVVETRLLESPLVVPRFVLTELQAVADSSDRLRRGRGRRGLDILNRLRTKPEVELEIFDRELAEFSGQSVDLKLVLLAKHLGGKVVTSDYNLNKVAQLHEVDVVNLNDLANALKPVFLPGEALQVQIVKAGEEAGQGVGYLDDGTMVVVEGAREQVHKQVRVTVTSVLQTSAGRMIFGRSEVLARA